MKQGLAALRDYSISLLLLLAAWWLASGPLGLPTYLLPSPEKTLAALVEAFRSGGLLGHLAFTLQNIILGLLVGLVAGVVVGYALVRLPRLNVWAEGPLVLLQTAPKIALAPLFVVWFGLGVLSKVVLIVSLVFFPVLVGAMTGFRLVDPRVIDLARLLRLGWFDRFLRIELVSALPEIFVGLRIGVVQALVGAILAEWISGQKGLGYLMTFSTATYKTPLLFAAVGLTVALGFCLHLAVGVLERRLLFWKTGK